MAVQAVSLASLTNVSVRGDRSGGLWLLMYTFNFLASTVMQKEYPISWLEKKKTSPSANTDTMLNEALATYNSQNLAD